MNVRAMFGTSHTKVHLYMCVLCVRARCGLKINKCKRWLRAAPHLCHRMHKSGGRLSSTRLERLKSSQCMAGRHGMRISPMLPVRWRHECMTLVRCTVLTALVPPHGSCHGLLMGRRTFNDSLSSFSLKCHPESM